INMLERHLPKDAMIENAPLPLVLHATDLLTGSAVALTRGPVIKAVLASACIPGLYIPQEWEEMLLVDGALTENVPLSGLKSLGTHLNIAVNLNGHFGYE